MEDSIYSAGSKKRCAKCGSKLFPGDRFCQRCGAGVAMDTDREITSGGKPYNETAYVIKAIVTIVCAALVVILATCLIANLVVIPKQMLMQGNFSGAYEKADADEKTRIADANLVAYLAEMGIRSEYGTFRLSDAWIDHEEKEVVLWINTTYYWYFGYDESESEYVYYGYVTSLIPQKNDGTAETLIYNIVKNRISAIKSDSSNSVSYDSISLINKLYDKGRLYNIELLEVNR